MVEAVGVAVDRVAGEPLVASEALRDGMLPVGLQADDLAVLDDGDEPASGLADTAEGGGLGHGSSAAGGREGSRDPEHATDGGGA
jgi:hypothetical protein